MSEFIRSYCLSKFTSNYRLVSDDTELVIPSIFAENDYNRHMSINLESGLWRCFKTSETGNFLMLYSKLERCSYREAYERLVFEDFIGRAAFKTPKVYEASNTQDIQSNLAEVENFKPIEDHPWVDGRMLSGFKFLRAFGGKYDGRLIIPFFNRRGRLFYFQARALDDRQPKYLNCRDVKASQVLYPFEYDSHEPLYIAEGVFDCMSLQAVGLNATTTLSCHVSKEQMLQLSQYRGKLVCAFDNDEAGLKGISHFMDTAYWAMRDDLEFVSPPEGSKDWNEVLVRLGPDRLLESATAAQKLCPMNLEAARLTYHKG
jgi:hypothetical protein